MKEVMTDWKEIDRRLTEEQNIRSYGTYRAIKALEIILGENITGIKKLTKSNFCRYYKN